MYLYIKYIRKIQWFWHMYTVIRKKVIGLSLIFGHNLCKCRPIFKMVSLTDL